MWLNVNHDMEPGELSLRLYVVLNQRTKTNIEKITKYFKFSSFKDPEQGVTKRCRLSLLTNSALVKRVQMRGEGGVAGSQPMSIAVHIT
jgi:hypothetical protein